jgi:cell division protease FtsH
MCGRLAGCAAEEVFTGQIGTGASDDLERTTKCARALVMMYGMSPKLPNINYNDSTGQDYGFVKPYSEGTAQLIDEEVARIIKEQYDRSKEILRTYSTEHNTLRDMLIKNEVIYTQDVEQVLGKRKWKSRTDEIMELNGKKSLPEKKESDEDDSDTPPPFEKV